jgi:hypothetical protein
MSIKKCTKCNIEKSLSDFYIRKDSRYKSDKESHCIACIKLKKKNWYQKRKHDADVRYKNLKSIAKQRNLCFTLSLNEYSVLIKQTCHYCNSSLEKHIGSGIDRKNNSIGYTLDNSVPCCTDCNLGKGEHYSYEEWKVMVNALLEYRKENGGGQQTRTAGPYRARYA